MKKAVAALNGLLHIVVVVGIVVCVFAVPYSPLAIKIYGGDLLVKHAGYVVIYLGI